MALPSKSRQCVERRRKMSLYAHHPTENSLGKCAPPPSLWHKLMSSFSTSRASLHAAADENTFWCSFEQNLATRSPNLCREHMTLLAHRLDRPHDRSGHLEACPHTAVHHVHPDLYAAIFSATFVTSSLPPASLLWACRHWLRVWPIEHFHKLRSFSSL